MAATSAADVDLQVEPVVLAVAASMVAAVEDSMAAASMAAAVAVSTVVAEASTVVAAVTAVDIGNPEGS